MPRSLTTVFIGSKNAFNEVLVHWLSAQTTIRGVVWTKSTAWQNTWRGRWKFARRRLKRYGLLKTLDELFMYLYYHAFLEDQEETELKRVVIDPYVARHGGQIEWSGDSIFAENVNDSAVIEFIRERNPEVAFAMCINNYFGQELRSIPTHGVLLWHEGYTPEYRGLYSPFWTVHNLDFDRLGFTLLRMDDKLDAGEILVQGRAKDIDIARHHHTFIGHKAIFDSLPQVKELLDDLERGSVSPVERPSAADGYYTYPGISDFIRQRLRLASYLGSR